MDNFNEISSDLRRMEMLRAALPYIPVSMQKFINIYLGFEELFNAIRMLKMGPVYYEEGTSPKDERLGNTAELLKTLRKFCTPQENEMINLFFQMSKIMENYDMYKGLFENLNLGETIRGMSSSTSDSSKQQTGTAADDFSAQLSSMNNLMKTFQSMSSMGSAMGNATSSVQTSKEIDDLFGDFIKEKP